MFNYDTLQDLSYCEYFTQKQHKILYDFYGYMAYSLQKDMIFKKKSASSWTRTNNICSQVKCSITWTQSAVVSKECCSSFLYTFAFNSL